MIWFTLRQFRAQTWVTVAGLAVAGVLLTITGLWTADLYTNSGLADCQRGCEALVANFLARTEAGVNITALVLHAVPALIGIFWGAPLIARELESGTLRLVWNQSVTRTRWLATKLLTIGLAAVATTGLLSVAVSIWANRIDQTAMIRITPFFFGARGIVAMAYAAFAFALGVTAGLLVRRTVPAMAVTLAVYIGAVASMPLWVRAHLLPVSRTTAPLDASAINGLMIYQPRTMTVIGDVQIPGAWIVSNETVTPAGEVFTGPPDPLYCGPDAGIHDCTTWLDTLNLRQDITYHPADHFWPLQWIESGVFLAATAMLASVCFWWINWRIP